MNELTKIRNVMRKVVPDAPHEVLLVLDASTGQNAYQQAKEFARATDITALAVTKLDGTAKGGVVVGIVDQFKVPVKFIGIGEGVDDLKVFDKKEFVSSLFSMDDIEDMKVAVSEACSNAVKHSEDNKVSINFNLLNSVSPF